MTIPAQEEVLAFRGLAVGYGPRAVLASLDQTVRAGEFVALLGPNGAGKTTLLKTLAGLQPPLAGDIWLGGEPMARLSPAAVARRLAVVLTERAAPALLTALELVCLGRHPHTGFLGRLAPPDFAQARRALELVGAAELAGRYLDQLSDGERQKIMLARALAQEPRVILLDEPTLHLDVKHRLEAMELLRGLCQGEGIAVVASLHDVDLALRLADTVGLVSQGGLAAWGPPERVLTPGALAGLYGLNGARFAPDLGVIEPRPAAGRGRVFVACGGGTGAGLLRLLAKHGFGLRAGVLHAHDLDCRVALALGAEVVRAAPFRPVSPGELAAARAEMAGCLAVVDSGFPVGADNLANLELLRAAARDASRPLLSLRPRAELAEWLGAAAGACRACPDAEQVVARLAALAPAANRQASGYQPKGEACRPPAAD